MCGCPDWAPHQRTQELVQLKLVSRLRWGVYDELILVVPETSDIVHGWVQEVDTPITGWLWFEFFAYVRVELPVRPRLTLYVLPLEIDFEG